MGDDYEVWGPSMQMGEESIYDSPDPDRFDEWKRRLLKGDWKDYSKWSRYPERQREHERRQLDVWEDEVMCNTKEPKRMKQAFGALRAWMLKQERKCESDTDSDSDFQQHPLPQQAARRSSHNPKPPTRRSSTSSSGNSKSRSYSSLSKNSQSS